MFAIEVNRDGSRCAAGRIFVEDAPHDGGLRFDDDALATFARDWRLPGIL